LEALLLEELLLLALWLVKALHAFIAPFVGIVVTLGSTGVCNFITNLSTFINFSELSINLSVLLLSLTFPVKYLKILHLSKFPFLPVLYGNQYWCFLE